MSTKEYEICQGLPQQLDAMWRFALRLSGDEADAADLVQRTCLRALERRESYCNQGKLRSWLFRILHNIWRNEIRSRRILSNQSFQNSDPSYPIVESVSEPSVAGQTLPETGVFMDQIVAAVESLPETQRTVMILCCVEGFSYRDASEILDIPLGTVMSRLSRGRLAIGQKIQPNQASNKAFTGLTRP